MKAHFAQMVVLALLLTVPTTQADTQIRMTQLQIALVNGNMSQLVDQIPLADAALLQEESEIAQETAVVPISERQARVLHRLERKIPRADRVAEKKVAELSDQQVATELARTGQASADSAANRAALTTVYTTMVRDSLPQLAAEIVTSGGMIPFLMKAKTSVKTAEILDPSDVSTKAKVGIALGSVVLLVVFALLFGWVLVVGAYLTLGLAGVIYVTLKAAND